MRKGDGQCIAAFLTASLHPSVDSGIVRRAYVAVGYERHRSMSRRSLTRGYGVEGEREEGMDGMLDVAMYFRTTFLVPDVCFSCLASKMGSEMALGPESDRIRRTYGSVSFTSQHWRRGQPVVLFTRSPQKHGTPVT